MSVVPSDEKNLAVHYMLLQESAQLEAEKQAKEAHTYVRYPYPQPSQPNPSLAEKIGRLREEYLPNLFQIENRDRLWIIVQGCAIGMVTFAIGSYVTQSSRTN